MAEYAAGQARGSISKVVGLNLNVRRQKFSVRTPICISS